MFKMNVKLNKKQTRREFLISTVRNSVVSGLGFMGIILGYKSVNSDPASCCEVNLPCRNCFKLGSCSEDKAVTMRSEIKQHNHPVQKTNEKNNG